MEGVTTAIVAFIFACLIWPELVKNKPQFYSALGLLLLVILLDAIGHMAPDGPLSRVMYVLVALVQILTILLLVLCVGGLTVRELGSEVSRTVEAIRRGGEEKPVLVPLKGETPPPRESKAEAAPQRINLTPEQPPPKPDDTGPVPLE